MDVCPLNKSDLRSLEYPVTKVFMKLFRTSCVIEIHDYQQYFQFPSVETCVNSRTLNFLRKYCAVNNLLCFTFANNAVQQLNVTQARTTACRTDGIYHFCIYLFI